MIRNGPESRRQSRTIELKTDLVIVGGGLAGTCAAVTAARAGIKVVLIQDRPVLGGNASSEVRLWILGATAHMRNNNRWAREGGVVDEILVENMYRNPDGNPLIVDTILLEKVAEEPNITLLLNTAVYDCIKDVEDRIRAVKAFCSQNSTEYVVEAPLFCDASGDGIVGFLSGAAFRMGAESGDEFGERFAPTKEYGELLGHSLYFYTKDVGRPVRFVPPSFALDDITKIPRYRRFRSNLNGCQLWWIEYGGRLDTVHDTEEIKWELWRIVYGVWNYIKNSGQFPDAENLTLEWVGHIPGKRESRRFEGPYMLTQQDIVEQRLHYDAVAHGGWSIDLHPADGVFSEGPPCDQWHARGVYQIPYRCLYSRNIKNLFLAGRIISASHVAFGSTRVMATCAAGAQAVAMAAAICIERELLPADISAEENITKLQQRLLAQGQHIPGLRFSDPADLVHTAQIEVSSEFKLNRLEPNGTPIQLDRFSVAQLLPVGAGPMPRVSFFADVASPTEVTVELRTSDRPDNYTPDVLLASRSIALTAGDRQEISVGFDCEIDAPRYVFFCIRKNEDVTVHRTSQRVTGLVSAVHARTQIADGDIGFETFEFWYPQRRPEGQNLALTVEPPLEPFGAENVRNGILRPTNSPNAWVADPKDPVPTLTLKWERPRSIGRIELWFDTDHDHAMESVLRGHPENVMPFCVKTYRIVDGSGNVVAERIDNYQTRNVIALESPITTDTLHVQCLETHGNAPAALFEVRCYAE